MNHALTARFDCPKCRYEGSIPCPAHASPATLDIKLWDNQIYYEADMWAEPQMTQTVLRVTEENAKEELQGVVETLPGKIVGAACITKVVKTKTRDRILVVDREQALQLIATLEQFVNNNHESQGHHQILARYKHRNR